MRGRLCVSAPVSDVESRSKGYTDRSSCLTLARVRRTRVLLLTIFLTDDCELILNFFAHRVDARVLFAACRAAELTPGQPLRRGAKKGFLSRVRAKRRSNT